MRTPKLGMLFALAACLSIALPASAGAKQIHKHIWIGMNTPRPVEVVRVVDVPPRDTDQDGIANGTDRCPHTASTVNGGCPPPAPRPTTTTDPAATSVPAPATPTVTTTSGGCPSYMAGEASSPDAVNPSSGAAGCYQVLPSTQAAMGSACSDVNSSSCVAAICAAEGNGAWASSGSTPCDYLKP